MQKHIFSTACHRSVVCVRYILSPSVVYIFILQNVNFVFCKLKTSDWFFQNSSNSRARRSGSVRAVWVSDRRQLQDSRSQRVQAAQGLGTVLPVGPQQVLHARFPRRVRVDAACCRGNRGRRSIQVPDLLRVGHGHWRLGQLWGDFEHCQSDARFQRSG